MSMEDEVKAECRFYALERSFCLLQAAIYRQMGAAGPVMLEETRKQAIESAQRQTFPALDPAMSDLVSAELEAAVNRLLSMTKQFLDGPSGHRMTASGSMRDDLLDVYACIKWAVAQMDVLRSRLIAWDQIPPIALSLSRI